MTVPERYHDGTAATACRHSWVRRIENIYRVVCEKCGTEKPRRKDSR